VSLWELEAASKPCKFSAKEKARFLNGAKVVPQKIQFYNTIKSVVFYMAGSQNAIFSGANERTVGWPKVRQ